jgi:hypothetical protein
VATIPPNALEEVYAVPPKEFTRARNARVAALAKSGHHDAAEALRRLRRPTATLWAVNQVARSNRKRLDAFIDAVAHVRRTQLRDPRNVGEAVQRQRTALDAVLEVARDALAEHGLTAGPQAMRRISSTLQGAAVDARHAEDLRHGRLTGELAAPGFEAFAGETPRRLNVLTGGRHEAKAAEVRQREAERHARRDAVRQERARKAEERERSAREKKAAAEQTAREVEALAEKLAEARRRLAKLRE